MFSSNPFPTDISAELAIIASEVIPGATQKPSWADLNHAAWAVYGFGSSQLQGAGVQAPVLASVIHVDAASARQQLAAILQPKMAKLGDGSFIKSLPWATIVPLLLKLFLSGL